MTKTAYDMAIIRPLHELQRVWMAIAEAHSVTHKNSSGLPAAEFDSSPAGQLSAAGASAASSALGASGPYNGERRCIDGSECIYFDGYWVRDYVQSEDSWAARKRLIDSLTRRAFHHTEPGINTPGRRLDEARTAYEQQSEPDLRRVNAAMLAGALFNRATDLFTRIVELEEQGVSVSSDNELMQACGECFQEALELGKQVKHHSGEEGIDELWGEPFRAFTLPVDKYFESRCIKISQTMANIDSIAQLLIATLSTRPEFAGVELRIKAFAEAARKESETMKSDPCIFHIWPRFVATGEDLANFKPLIKTHRKANGEPNEGPGIACSRECEFVMEHAYSTLVAGRDLIKWVAQARVPMPESTRAFAKRCEALSLELSHC